MTPGRCLRAALALCVAAAVLPAAADPPAADLRDALRDAFLLFDRQDMAAARAAFDSALSRARAAGDAWAAAEATRGLGRVHYRTGRYAEADAALQQALDGFLELDDRLGAARCVSHLATLASALGRTEDARGAWLDALPEFTALEAGRDEAETLFNLAVTATALEERRAYLERAAAVAATLDLPRLEGAILAARGEMEHEAGDYGAAQDHLEQAAQLWEQAGAKGDLSRAYNALSRLERVHQRREEAILLDEKALRLQEETEDLQGAIFSLDHLADAYSDLGRHRRALALYERALALARKSGAARNVEYVRGRTADAYIRMGDWAAAARLLEEVLAGASTSDERPRWLTQLSGCQVRLGRAQEGLASAERALELIRPTGRRNTLLPALRARAYARAALGQLDAANADLHEELEILEDVRGKLSPRDFLKRGFAEQYKSTFAQAVVLLDRAGRPAEALETAERARARAFLDLLAARRREADTTKTGADAAPDVALASPASAAAASLAGVTATARRLDTTIMSYFVTDIETFIWVVDARGLRASVRRPIGARALALLVARTAPDVETAPPRPAAGVQVASRGGGLLLTSERVHAALRRLYAELVAPVRSSLPRAPGARLTLIPHGPLARLPFAALIDGRGRYLVESFTLHAAPAAAVFDFTAGAARDPRRPALFVADPARFPGGRPVLAALPATREEVTASSGALAPATSSLLLGAEATEANVRARWPEAGLIHFATHAVVRDDEPFESFLALQPGRGGAGDDGRLTAGEVQGLALQARLVVLSACSTARGPSSADGIVGLTRAFFTAGASSVVATLWDVPDGPSARVMSAFYRGLAGGAARDRALRAAQLGVLRALRAGRLTVPFAGRQVALPEHPALWAGFVLLGEP